MSVQPEEPAGGQDHPDGPADERAVSLEDERSADDTDEGWGERSSGFDDDWYLEQRPPHWD